MRPGSYIGNDIMRLALAFSIAASVAVSSFVVASPADARQAVSFREDFAPGTVVIKHSQRRLYYVVGGGKAIAYTVGVGRAGKSWFGTRYIDGKRIRPAWAPPAEVKRDNPRLPNVIPGGVPSNPMGAAALTLSGGEYAIHGTNAPGSIGGFVSYGCIRMYNQDIVDLYGRVNVGTPVIVTR
jgi:lipoprotein-anchoring transpeptidase ErfK/SrfK